MAKANSKKESVGRFAYDGLDRVIHEKARLSVLTSLIAHPKGLVFGDLKQMCGLTDGNLSRHLQVLEEAGLIEKRVERQFRVVRARPAALRPLGSWYERQQRHWSDAFDRLEAVIAAETPKRRKS
jgi:DNA-binding transcriptional ArsR family regulator